MLSEAPRPSQETYSAPAMPGENVLFSSPSVDLSSGLVISRRPNVRRAGVAAGVALTLAAWGSTMGIGNRASAQGGESPAPITSFEPGASIVPNGGTAQGEEIPCDTEINVAPAALLDPAPSLVPSFAPESPSPSIPIGGDIVAGDPDSETEGNQEPISTYEKFVKLLDTEEDPCEVVQPEMDFDSLSKEIIEFYDADFLQLEFTKRFFGDTPKKLLADSKNELEIEEINGRNPEAVSKPLEAMLATFANTGSEKVLEYIQNYIVLTEGEMSEEYTIKVLSMLETFKTNFDEHDAKKGIDSGSEVTEPAPDSLESLIGVKVNKKATFEDVSEAVSNIYSNKDFESRLKDLRSALDINFRMTEKFVNNELRGCLNDELVSDRVIECTDNLADFTYYARQFSLDSGDETDAVLNTAWMDAARLLRSATINSGVPKGRLDRLIRQTFPEADSLPLPQDQE